MHSLLFLHFYATPSFSFSLGIDKGGQGGDDGCRGRRCAGGGIDRVWAETWYLSGVGGSEVESKGRVHQGVERVGQDEVEVMFVRVHGLG